MNMICHAQHSCTASDSSSCCMYIQCSGVMAQEFCLHNNRDMRFTFPERLFRLQRRGGSYEIENKKGP